ncbi:ABC transporter permease [Dyadobacter sp. CY347]|uniref:ABC transporter permease n=1 Tax=Dyadobacter sp. CY347 TaxID=2909336 RepID=UPI001F263E84|nr:hypothetical protein [Dyadobacter sp. CY347]MCF2488290.1 hypothetical protein [Dyadobacter sp. CY347]
MIKNYLKIAIRNLTRNKIFSFINIAGLSLGLTCCMLIVLYTKDEVNFDRFQEHKDRLFRTNLAMELKIGDNFEKLVVSGVAKKSPQNSSVQFGAVIPFELQVARCWTYKECSTISNHRSHADSRIPKPENGHAGSG